MKSVISIILIIWQCSLLKSQVELREQIWKEGVTFMRDKDYLQGLERMNKFLKLYPANYYAMYNRAICKMNLGDNEGACNDFMTMAIYKPSRKNDKYFKYSCDLEYKLDNLKEYYYKDTEIYPELGHRPRYTRADSLRGALRPERNCYDVFFYNLTVKILPVSKSIEGRNEIWFKSLFKSPEIQIDLFNNYTIQKIVMDSVELKFRREFNAVFIKVPDYVTSGKSYKIEVFYSGKPRTAPNPPWQGGFVWSRDKRLNRWVGVACEQYGASSWWPCKDHLSDKPDSMAINIEVPGDYQAVCNGTLKKVVPAEKNYTRYEWFVHYPINNYNATFYMGKYAEFTDTAYIPSDTLVFRYHVLPCHLEYAKEYFKQTKEVVAYYNKAFGPYPFPKDDFRLVESPYEGMEHQTAIAYGNAYNKKKSSREYLNKEFDYIIVHEAAHEWWGNSLAAGDMADIWIHEGFATYAEYLFLEEKLGYDSSVAELHNHMHWIYNVWPMVQNRDVNEDAFASNDVYYKGATLLHCLRATINNDTLFKNMLRDFHLAYRFKTVDSDEFIRYVNNYTGSDHTALFDIFLYETRMPVLQYSYERNENTILLKYKWTGVKDGFEMPFSITTIGEKNAYRLQATTNEQQIILENATSFSFYNLYRSTEGCPRNGLTYYATKCMNDLNRPSGNIQKALNHAQ